MKRLLSSATAIFCGLACGGPSTLPKGPPPEYEVRPAQSFEQPQVADPLGDLVFDSLDPSGAATAPATAESPASAPSTTTAPSVTALPTASSTVDDGAPPKDLTPHAGETQKSDPQTPAK